MALANLKNMRKKWFFIFALCSILVYFSPFLAFAEWTDVSSSFNVVRTRPLYDFVAKDTYCDITLTNISGQIYQTPIRLVIVGITNSQVTVRNADGTTNDGRPYFNYGSMFGADNRAEPNETSSPRQVRFYNPNRLRFDFSTEVRVEAALPPNQRPVSNAGENQTIQLSSGQTSVIVQLDGSRSNDPDGTIVSYIWTGNPDPADVANPSVTLSAGSYTFTLVVTDNRGASSDPSTVTVTVLSPPQNQPPIANAGTNRTVILPPGQNAINVQLSGSGTDPDGTIVAYLWSGTPDPQDIQNPVVSLGEGSHVFSLVVRDNLGAESEPSIVTIQVNRANPPVLSVSSLNYTINQGQEVRIEVSAIDPDGEPVTLSATPVLANASFSATPGTNARGIFTFIPDSTQLGAHFINFKARDPLGLNDSKTVQINVNKVNRPPELIVPASASVDEGKVLTLQVQASDPNGDIVTLSASNLPNNAIFIGSTGTLTFAPNYNQAGIYQVTFTASDGQLSTSRTVPITVQDVPFGGPGQPGELNLQVDPVESPTFLPAQRITGTVNITGAVPTAPKIKSALITGMSPTTGEQGQTLTVLLTGQGVGDYATHFTANVSKADFGAGVTVNSIHVTSPTQAIVNITVSPKASTGPRSVNVATGGEVAVSVVAFNVVQGRSRLVGNLIDPDTGHPISGALVGIQGTNITGVTNMDGFFVLLDVPAGQFTLIVNAPNYELMTQMVDAPMGQMLNLGSLKPRSTVYNPSAPPSVSLLSVLGRGAGDPTSVKDGETLRQVIRDAMLLVGGDEAGILDEYGNQLNPDVAGNGVISMTPAGLNLMAEHLTRGESAALQDILFALSFGMTWSAGHPINLEEWLVSLQALVNQAWQDPYDLESALPILIFNKGRNLMPDPPALSPHTRLNTFQGYLLVASLLGYIEQRQRTDSPPAGPMLAMSINNSMIASDAYPSTFGRSGLIIVQAAPPPSPLNSSGKKPFTGFWRNFFSAKANIIQKMINAQYTEAAIWALTNQLLLTAGSIYGTMAAVMNVGTVPDDFTPQVINANVANRWIPESPSITGADVVKQADGTSLVKVVFSRSPSDTMESTTARFIYQLYRFGGADQNRTLIDRAQFGVDSPLEFRDVTPLAGTSFYSLTVTRYTRLHTPETESWWSGAFSGSLPIFLRGAHRLTSDYSAPRSVYVGPIDFSVTLDGIEVDPDPDKDIVYYSDAGKGILYKVMQGGLGDRTVFAEAGFKPSPRDGRMIVQSGLAIDSQGNLYCDNAASDDQFGGRLFKFSQPNGARSFVGTINYFSQLLMFAHPTFSGPMVIRPHNDPALEDLFVIDNLTQEIKAVPVNQPWDPYRRVGQPYGRIPEGGVGRAIDMQFDKNGNLYVLDGWRVIKFESGVPTTEALFTPD